MAITKGEYISAVTALASSVWDFHDRFGVEQDEELADVISFVDKYQDRILIQLEELGEFTKDVNRHLISDAREEAADVAYVALGTILTLGEAGKDATYTVVEKNDAKMPGEYVYRAGGSGKIVRAEE